ncbi:MAG: HPF/RaiA family ribosome-associated protein [Bdellovibrionales bacterium]|nr:HPF/RaiA family ribosome-associated protein [Bdellovibrionales bacterium]
MRTEIVFKDIRRSEYAEDFINDKVDALVEKLIQPDSDLHITVRLERSRARTAIRQGLYQCEVFVKSGMSDRVYKTVRQDRNLFRAVVASFDALKVVLGKNHDRLRHDRRRRRVPAYESYTPPPINSPSA